MNKDKKDNSVSQNEIVSKGKTFQDSSRSLKKILLAIAVIAITSGAFAQTGDQNNYNKNTTDKNSQNMSNHPDGYMMHNGKMVMVKNGKMTPIDNDVTLSNGTIIMKNGGYMKKGGKKVQFKEGEHMDMEGNLIPMDKMNKKPVKKDTTNWNRDTTDKKMK